METLILLTAWIVVIAGVDVAIIRPWKSQAARAPLALVLGTAAALWVLATGFIAYRQMMTDGAWTGASIAMAFVPAKAIVVSLLAYAAGRSFLSARMNAAPRLQRWALPALLAAAVLYTMGSDITALHASAQERHARNPALTSEEVQALAQKVRAGDAGRSETYAFLGNPRCPGDLLADYAASADAYWRTAVAGNDMIDPALAGKLTTDPDEQVRYRLAFNRKLPPDVLTRLAADSSDNVRDAVAWTDALPDDAFDRLVNDPSAKVRATAALQSRLSEAQRDRLRGDPDQRVRDAVNGWNGE